MANEIQIDQAALQAEISKLSPEQMASELLKIQTRKKVQQKKHQGSEQQKKYQAKQREKFRLMRAQAEAAPATEKGFANLWEQISSQADSAAEEQVGQEAVAEEA